MRRLRAVPPVLAAAAALVLASGGGGAAAAPSLLTSSYTLSGPAALALVGPQTLIGTRKDMPTDVVRSFAPGQASKPLSGGTFHTNEESAQTSFVASPSRLIAHLSASTEGYKGSPGGSSEALESGPLGAAPAKLTAGCLLAPSIDPSIRGEAAPPEHTAFAVDGEVVAYDSYGCVFVRDFASGLQRIVPLDATLAPVIGRFLRYYDTSVTLLRAAGRLIAYRANPPGGEGPAKVVVYDIDTAQPLYDVPLPESSETYGGPSFDLQPDGTLVIANAASCAASVSTIAEPAPRPLGVPACSVRRVRDGRALVLVPGPERHRLLAWTPLEAPVAHPIADLGPGGALEVAMSDMDESDAVYALGGCFFASVYRTSLLDPGSPPAPPASCPVRVRSHGAMLSGRTLRVRLTCPLGCRGSFSAQLGTPRQLRRESGLELMNEGELITLPPGRSKTFDLLADSSFEVSAAKIRRELRRDRRLRVGLSFTTDAPQAEGPLNEKLAETLHFSYEPRSEAIVPIALQRKRRGPD
jgi:hypothetical protein